MKWARRALVGLCLATSTITVASCGSADKIGGAQQNETLSIELSQTELTLGVGSTIALQAAVRDGSGRSLSDRRVFWSSSNDAIARVSASGVVTAVAPGEAQIAATHEGRSAVATVTVAPRSVASIVLSPSEPGVLVGGTVQLSARTLDANGEELEGRVVTWTSSNNAIAVIDTTGAVTGVSAGFVTIVARSEGRTASVGVTVSLVPVASIVVNPLDVTIVTAQTTQLSAELFDATGASLGERPLVWSTSNASVASVSSDGLVLGIAPGSATITVASGGRSAESRVNVQPRPVSSVIVSPGQASLIVGQSLALSVQVTDVNGTLLVGRPVQFSSANSAVAQVSSSGTVTGVSAGTTTVTVTSEGKTAQVPVTVSPVSVASVRIEPTTVDLIIGGTRKLTATAHDASGNVLSQRAIAWTSGSPSVATVSNDGTVTAITPGTAVIVASSEGRVATATVNVRVVPVSAVVISPQSPTLIIGDALDMTFVARDAAGNILDGRVAFWTSSNEQVAVVSSAGRVVGRSAGTAEITASVDGTTGSVTVSVIVEPVLTVGVQPTSIALHPTQTAQITATPRGRNGIALTGRTIKYTSGDVTVATVSNSGLVTALKAGTTTITVEVEGKTASVPVTITPVPISTITVSLGSPSLFVGQGTAATAVLRDSAGNPILNRSVSWSTSNALVATVSQTGQVTALLPGTAQITATAEGKSGSATVTVSLSPVATVSVSLNPSAVQVGQTSQATAVLRDALGLTLTNRNVTWSSSNTSVATINADGEIVALAQGSATITGTSEGKSGTATLSVSNLSVSTVTVALDPSSITVGSTSQATATMRAANGTLLTGRAHTWSSSNTTVATVSSTGVVTALGAGTASITATSEGRSGSATLTVTNVPVATVTVTLTPSSVQVGQTSTATSTVRDANGNVLNGRVTTWSSSNTSIATVNSSGVITTLAPGTVTITGTSETRTGSATLTVTAAPVATVAVTLSPSTVAVGQPSTASAVLRDASNNVLTGRVVTWQSSNTTVATVNASTGAITTLASGSSTITATSEGKTGSAVLTVSSQPVATVTVALNPSTIAVGATAQATATLRASDGTVLTGRAQTWSSSNTSVATVNSATGVVTAVASGTASIIATSEGRTGSATITVSPAPVATVTVSLTPATIAEGQSATASAVLRDANNNILSGRTITWQSSNTAVATVNASTGAITALSAGTSTITGTSEGKSGTATLTVTALAVSTVTVSLSPSSVIEGATSQATAVLRASNGTVLNNRNVSWSSSNTSIATVDADGLVTTLRSGSVTITATSEGRTGNATLSVTQAAVASVVVTPSTATIESSGTLTGRRVQLTAKAFDANGRELIGRNFSWSSNRTNVATVSNSGLVTGQDGGTATISASTGGRTGTAVITVRN